MVSAALGKGERQRCSLLNCRVNALVHWCRGQSDLKIQLPLHQCHHVLVFLSLSHTGKTEAHDIVLISGLAVEIDFELT